MAILKVATLGNPILRQIADPVPPREIKGQEIQRLIRDMVETMREYGGVGLAAPQVHRSLQVIVIEELGESSRGAKQKPKPLQVLINPSLSIISEKLIEDWEGCLSVPDLRGKVPRHAQINVRAFDAAGKCIELRARNFHARVIQHERDHLIGRIFLERMISLESLTYLQEFDRYWRAEKGE